MDVTESTKAMRLIDEESIDVSMGGDTSIANVEDKESSPISKKPRGINIGKRKLRSPAWETFDLLPLGEDKKRRAKCKSCETIYVCDSRVFFAYVSPDIKLPCRNIVKARVLRMFKSERQKIQSLLSSDQGRICLTSDLWTSLCTDGYLALTAHFVDKDWRLQKRIINSCHMPPPHSGVTLFEKINTFLTEEIDSSVTKIRECVKHIKGSEARKQKFYDCVAQVGIVGRYFNEVTCLFSGTKYPTSNLFFPKIFIIQHQIKAAMEDSDIFMNKIGTNMNMKFEKYWSKYNLILAIAIILDPRYKLHFVEWAYTKLHGKDSREFKCVTDTLTCLFDVYTENLSPILNASYPTNETTSHNEGGDTILEDFDNSYKNGSSSCKKNELHKYLDEERLDRKQDIDVLSWWQMEHFHYPILSHIAQVVLTIPISTIA
ncbi:hypothetical protein PRUPE_6G144800 [Prunus persica]|uniref:hAT-like transposase RNase-H fold domain-containing protein n=1 Tax=Prunus persica TaxID=3760 RepID=A0A251NT77_PRUPE|nr:hypothetical protein PRUPE_6G144800 [Prunus persica]